MHLLRELSRLALLVVISGTTACVLTVVAQAQPKKLAGTSWQLVKFQSSDDTTLTPDDKSKYTISFAKNNRVAVRLDCNRGSGTWKSSAAGKLQFGPMALTRAMCPDMKLHDRIARDWTAVRSYLIKDGHLFLSLMADGGIYEFEPLPVEAKVTGTITYRQRIALTPDAMVEVNLVDVSRADAPSESIAKTEIQTAGRQVPIAFELPYDASKIDQRHRYAVQVRILEGGTLRWTNAQAYHVITLGNPNTVTVLMQPVRH